MASTQEILRLVERFSALGQFRSLPLAQAPPKGRANPDKSCAAQGQKESRFCEPCDRRHAKRHDEAENADLPGYVDSRAKRAKGRQTRSPYPGPAEVNIF